MRLGVISHPDEPPIAVAVLTQSARRERTIPLSNTVGGGRSLATAFVATARSCKYSRMAPI